MTPSPSRRVAKTNPRWAFGPSCSVPGSAMPRCMSAWPTSRSSAMQRTTPAVGLPPPALYIGHYMAWIAAALMLAAQIKLSQDANPVPGPMAANVAGLAGIICVIAAGWTTANPTIYRAGLAFQAMFPGSNRTTVHFNCRRRRDHRGNLPRPSPGNSSASSDSNGPHPRADGCHHLLRLALPSLSFRRSPSPTHPDEPRQHGGPLRLAHPDFQFPSP